MAVRKPISERFWSKVNKNGPTIIETPCWEWTAVRMHDGYGQFWFADQMYRAHRFALEERLGRPLGRKHACHRCDNRACVNPDHLYVGTNNDNVQDKTRKGRCSRVNPRLSPNMRVKLFEMVRSGATPMEVWQATGLARKTVTRYFKLYRNKAT